MARPVLVIQLAAHPPEQSRGTRCLGQPRSCAPPRAWSPPSRGSRSPRPSSCGHSHAGCSSAQCCRWNTVQCLHSRHRRNRSPSLLCLPAHVCCIFAMFVCKCVEQERRGLSQCVILPCSWSYYLGSVLKLSSIWHMYIKISTSSNPTSDGIYLQFFSDCAVCFSAVKLD